MKIKNRIALQFTLLVAAILLLFSITIYSVSEHYRQEEFYDRLKSRARTTCRLLVKVKGIDKHLLKAIDQNTLSEMLDEKVLIFNADNELIYSSVDDKLLSYKASLLDEVREKQYIEFHEGGSEVIGLLYQEQSEPLTVLASAYDTFGHSKLTNLRETLGWGLLAGIAVTVGLGIYFAGNALRPISRINHEVSLITAQNLSQKLDEGNRKDEIAQLAINFNTVLVRLHNAFEQQKSFVSHASHELRTPLAALKSEIQLGQRFNKNNPDLDEVFANLFSDTERLISITNNLLFLARSYEHSGQLKMAPIHIEDLAFAAKEELLSANPDYRVEIDYENIPEDENQTVIEGNEELLKRVFSNLLDNACKYSSDHQARILISSDNKSCIVKFKDQGIGISPEDMPHIFNPFYRSSDATTVPGFGIGLSICQRIIDLHHGTISVTSEPGQGSEFQVRLNHV
ncbi:MULTISPECIES: ATP-binding protein [Dyadobacter]|uniref:histidine kinase n=1 Tax=Dyadobacter chenhuakuii TaxID=2909339 RepID=A0A9X1QG47_9BACT|nr:MULTISPECIES: ATP-binding protein [Dyadobacter]MCE7071391.1 ATP-binding protein [Dyadobacter sp. CY327]MCF2500765.1 ATP-binding protein [Dyadobacter chenhuakuii]MCF2517971.1 ATP-binding protein [Dyadobacter sp. CY351]